MHPDRFCHRPALPWLLPAALLLMTACGGDGEAAKGAAPAGQASKGAPGQPAGPEEKKPEDAIAVRVAPVRRSALSSLYSTSATLRADKQATVIARTRGVVDSLLVEEGAVVRAGQPLARLENDEQRINAERAKVIRETKRQELDRLEALHRQKLVSEQEFETARHAAEDARHAYALAELELERTTIRAPFGGTILKRHLDPGATVADGTSVYSLADLEPLFADVTVPERHVSRLSPGQSVRLSTDHDEAMLPARIERIAPSVDPQTGTVKVTLAVEAAAASMLRPGSFVRVDIVTDTHQEALVVPRSALVAEGRRWHLFRLEPGDEKVKQLEVKLGYEEGDHVEIAEVVGGGALEVGTRVVVSGAPALDEGALVKVMETQAVGPKESAQGEPKNVTP